MKKYAMRHKPASMTDQPYYEITLVCTLFTHLKIKLPYLKDSLPNLRMHFST